MWTPNTGTGQRVLAPLLLAAMSAHVFAHPSAIGGGRGSCGAEYDTPDKAYYLPDISESWYLRRIATCDKPVFWQRFDSREHSPLRNVLYIGGTTPLIKRYADTFKLNIALFGATLPSQSLLPKGALSGIVLNDKLKGLGATVLTGAPASYESCDFVDNVVMKQYVKPMSHNLTGQPANRCTEHHFYAKEEGKPMYLRYERYWTTYWIFNEEFALPAPGEYYVASWLTDRNTGAVMNGKYEMTMGPYTWYGYADAATTAQTQEQGTTCTCGYNKADFDEQNLGKIGIGQDLLEYRLQPERCHSLAGGANNSLSGGGEIDTCRAGGLKQQLSHDTEIEWAALFDLAPGKYTWSFKPFGGKDVGFSYPDKAMTLFIVATASLDNAEKIADATLKSSDTTIVNRGEALSLASSRPQAVQFTHDITSGASADFHFTVPDLNNGQAVSYAFFSQHQPWEFQADFFTSSSGQFHFPTDVRFYDMEWPGPWPASTTAANTTTLGSTAGSATAVAKAAAAAAAKAYTAAGCNTDAAKDGCAELKKAKAAADAKVDLAEGNGGGSGSGSGSGVLASAASALGAVAVAVACY